MSYTGGPTSLAHPEEDVGQTIQALDGAVREALAAGAVDRR